MTVDDPYTINEKEFEAVIGLPGSGRYEHFIKRVGDTGWAYALVDEEDRLVALVDDAGRDPQIPLWPHPRYAEAYRQTHGGAAWGAIGGRELLDELLPALAEDGAAIAVLPTPDGNAPLVEPLQLRGDLDTYLDEWYGERPWD